MAAKQKKATTPSSFHYDAIVIGTGPGGEGVAMRCFQGAVPKKN